MKLRTLQPKLDECVHCGFCLPTCPTYAETGAEMDSPRGRIYLIQALAQERIEPTPVVLEHLDRCLDCRACETACPSGVRYGQIIETTRGILEKERKRTPWVRFLRRLGFQELLPHRSRLRAIASVARFTQSLSVLERLRRADWFDRLPDRIRHTVQLAPSFDASSFTDPTRSLFLACSPTRGRVGLFSGCIADHAFSRVHEATARVLVENGFEVVVPDAQTCCGALHIHNGEPELARDLLERNQKAFRDAGSLDAIIINAAGCGAHLEDSGDEYPWLAQTCVDLSAFLHEKGIRTPLREVPLRAVYDAPCHLQHAQGVHAAPVTLLESIPGLTLLPLEESDWCCGSAGIYNLTQPEMSARLQSRKVEKILASGADAVITGNPGCMIQIKAGLRDRGSNVEVFHTAEILDRAVRS